MLLLLLIIIYCFIVILLPKHVAQHLNNHQLRLKQLLSMLSGYFPDFLQPELLLGLYF